MNYYCQRYEWGFNAIQGILIFILIAGIVLFSLSMLGGIFATIFSSFASMLGGMVGGLESSLSFTGFFPDLNIAFPILDCFGGVTDSVASFDSSSFGFENMETTLSGLSDSITQAFKLPPELRSLLRF